MRLPSIFMLLAMPVLGLIAQTPIRTGPTVFSGRIWPEMNASEKFYYVSGYHQGIQMAAILLPQEIKLAVLRNNIPAGFTASDFVVELDAFYKVTENLNIALPMACLHIARKLQGTTSKVELEKNLIKLRQIANRQ